MRICVDFGKVWLLSRIDGKWEVIGTFPLDQFHSYLVEAK